MSTNSPFVLFAPGVCGRHGRRRQPRSSPAFLRASATLQPSVQQALSWPEAPNPADLHPRVQCSTPSCSTAEPPHRHKHCQLRGIPSSLCPGGQEHSLARTDASFSVCDPGLDGSASVRSAVGEHGAEEPIDPHARLLLRCRPPSERR